MLGSDNQFVKTDRKGNPKKDQDKSSTLSVGGHGCGNHSDMDCLVYPAAITERRTEESKKIRRETKKDSRRGKELTLRKDDKMNCLTAAFSDKEHCILIPKSTKIRRLTPIECERLQTVPDNYTNHVSDSQRYKMLGNGWTVDVIAYIFKHMVL